MATATVLQFMQKTAEDSLLREQLEEIIGVGDGDISSETELDPDESAALKGERAPLVADFALRKGYKFTVEDLITVVDAFEQHQKGQLSDEEFGRMIGLPEDKIDSQEGVFMRLSRYLSKTYLGIDR